MSDTKNNNTTPLKVDTVDSFGAAVGGPGPNRLMNFIANGFDPKVMRTNAVLRHEDWLALDAAVLDVALPRLNIVEQLRAAGLVHPLNGIAKSMTGYEKSSDISGASVSMDGLAQSENDVVDFSEVQIPVPIIHKDYRINLRKLVESRNSGEGIDVTLARKAARQVAEELESMVFSGNTAINVNGQTIYGLTNEPNANSLSGSDWGTITNIYTNCNSAIAELEADNYFGPYVMYVATVQYGQMRALYTDGAPESALTRVLRGLPQISAIYPSDTLTAGTAVMFQLDSDVIDLAIGADISNIEWETKGGWVMWNKVYAVMVPRVKSDYDGRSGIVNISGI